MNKLDFIKKFIKPLEEYYEKTSSPNIITIYYNSLIVYSEWTLNSSLKEIYENYCFFPKVKQCIVICDKIKSKQYSTFKSNIENIENIYNLPTEHRKIKEKLKFEFGNDIYATWLSKLSIISINDTNIIMSVPTEFIKDWITKEFLNGYFKTIKGKQRCVKKGIKESMQEIYPNLEKIIIEVKYNGKNLNV